MQTDSTYVFELTRRGQAALATVAVAGPRAVEIVDSLFHAASRTSLAGQPPQRILFGRWGQAKGEETIVARLGADSVEIHCHGGQTAVSAIVSDLVAAGCVQRLPEDWAAEQEDDPIARDARLALTRARTQRAASILLDQYQGSLRTAIQRAVSLIHKQRLKEAQNQLDALIQNWEIGRHLVQPWQVVLAGRPNVGKSSLINAVLGYQRAIVFDQPGTTRDLVTATTALDGWPVELTDTAGLRDSQQPIEQLGVRQANRIMAAADLRVLVFDVSAPWSADDRQLHQRWPDALVVHNKTDLATNLMAERPPGVSTSAVTGSGVDKLCASIISLLVPNPPKPQTAVPFSQAHIQSIRLANEALAGGVKLHAAMAELNGLVSSVQSMRKHT